MRKILALLLSLLLLISAFPALADSTPAATPLPGYTLRPASEEIRVFATRSMKANIVGYIIPGGRQEVHVLSVSGDWCYVSFTSVYGVSYGYVPLSCFDIAVQATPTPLPVPSYETGTSAWVLNGTEGSRLNLRTAPSASAVSLGKYYTGTPVTMTGRIENGYAEVLLAGMTMGWMDLRYLTTDVYALVPETPIVLVSNNGGGATLRSGPSTSYDRLGWYPHGTPITILGVRADGWYHVTAENETGFMSETLLSGKFPYQYGTDSDNPILSGSMANGEMQLYINTRSAGGKLNLRKSASASSKSLGLFYTGTPVTVISFNRSGWAYVRIGHAEGYMDADYLTSIKPTQYGETRIIRNSRASGLNLRSLPSTGGELLAFAENYSYVTVLGELSDGWSFVDYGGTIGYMLSSGLKTN